MAAKKLNLIPAPGIIVIEPVEAETKTASGIYLPDGSGEKPQTGVVLAVGDDEMTENGKRSTHVKEKDKVLFKKWGGNEVTHQGKNLLFAKFDDILAVVK